MTASSGQTGQMHTRRVFNLAAALLACLLVASLPVRALGDDSPAAPASAQPVTEAAKVLAGLEAIMPKDARDQQLIEDFKTKVIALVELNGLTTGEEFHRASILAG